MLSGAAVGKFNPLWWLAVFPGLAITITVLAINLAGDSLRDSSTAAPPPRRLSRDAWSHEASTEPDAGQSDLTRCSIPLARPTAQFLATDWRCKTVSRARLFSDAMAKHGKTSSARVPPFRQYHGRSRQHPYQ